MTTHVPPSLVEAFHQTRYTVHAPHGDFTMRIGEHSAALQRLIQGNDRRCCALLTAYNPEARPIDPQANAENQQQFERAVKALGLPCHKGENVPAERKGPVEPSLLVLGLSRERAYELALQLRQLAFVYADEHAVPELVWVDIKAADRTRP